MQVRVSYIVTLNVPNVLHCMLKSGFIDVFEFYISPVDTFVTAKSSNSSVNLYRDKVIIWSKDFNEAVAILVIVMVATKVNELKLPNGGKIVATTTYSDDNKIKSVKIELYDCNDELISSDELDCTNKLKLLNQVKRLMSKLTTTK